MALIGLSKSTSVMQLHLCLFLLVALCSRSALVSADRWAPAWHSPCSATGHQTSRMEGLFQNLGETDTEDEIVRHQTQLMIELQDATTNARRLNRYILRRRLLSNRYLVGHCEDTPTLLGMPQVEVTHELVEQGFHSTLPYDFQRLAKLAVFVSEIAEDSHGHHHYRRQLDTLLGNIQNSMCLMEIVALSRGQTITRDVTEHVMPAIYKDLPDQAVRDLRNCLIVRDAAEIFDNIQEWYSQRMY